MAYSSQCLIAGNLLAKALKLDSLQPTGQYVTVQDLMHVRGTEVVTALYCDWRRPLPVVQSEMFKPAA
jgi:hypothetical protein